MLNKVISVYYICWICSCFNNYTKQIGEFKVYNLSENIYIKKYDAVVVYLWYVLLVIASSNDMKWLPYKFILGVLLYVPLNCGQHRLGGSALAQCFKQIGDDSPNLDDASLFIRAYSVTQQLIKGQKIKMYWLLYIYIYIYIYICVCVCVYCLYIIAFVLGSE